MHASAPPGTPGSDTTPERERLAPHVGEARALLARLCRREPGDALASAVPLLGDGERRASFLATASELRIAGLVLARLESAGVLGELAEPAALELRAELTAVRRRVAAQMLEQERVLVRWQRAGITPVLLKGAALRATIYAEPAERRVGDLDVLVERSQLEAACEVLVAIGYEAQAEAEAAAYARHHFHLRLRHPFGHLVEVHWALTEPQALARLDATAFLRDATFAPSTRAPRRVPRMEHTLLHLASQNATDGYAPLRRLVDVDRIVAAAPDLDWRRLVDDARAGGLRTALALTLAVARQLLHTPVPAWAHRELRPSAMVRRHLALLNPAPRALGAHAPGATASRLAQLWVLAGDHGIGRALAWLEQHGWNGPVRRGALDGAAARRWTRAAARVKLATYQLGLSAGISGAARRGEHATDLWRGGDTA